MLSLPCLGGCTHLVAAKGSSVHTRAVSYWVPGQFASGLHFRAEPPAAGLHSLCVRLFSAQKYHFVSTVILCVCVTFETACVFFCVLLYSLSLSLLIVLLGSLGQGRCCPSVVV